MRKKINYLTTIFLSLAILLFIVNNNLASADKSGQKQQKPGVVGDYIKMDINNISTFIRNNGSFNRDPGTGNAGFEWPKGSGNTANYASGIWVGAIDNATGQVCVAVAEYSYEYIAGPIGVGINPADDRWKMYKISRGDNAENNPDYANWPVEDGAPWVDVNGNGVWDPGIDTPELLGDQTVWCVFNDNDPAVHTNMLTPPLGIEVQLTAFAYARSDALGNTIFYKWKIINKGGKTLKDAYITIWTDIDLGDSGDDYDGCDTTLGLGYTYNYDAVDGVYGVPPATGFDFFQGPIVPSPGDTAYVSGKLIPDYKNLKMTSFVKYNNDTSPLGNPQTGAEVYNYMRAYDRNGVRITDPLGNPANFMFPGDPTKPYDPATNWLEQGPGGDRRFLMSSGPFTMAPGDTQEIVAGNLIALGSDYLQSVNALKQADLVAQTAYDLNFKLAAPPASPKVEAIALDNQIVLNWGIDHEYASTIEETRTFDPLADAAGDPDPYYVFEGYVVYQYSNISGSDEKIVATYDIKNNVMIIYDDVFDPNLGAFVNRPVKFGSDNGLKRSISITKDFLTNNPIVNGKDYYFAVTAYTYNKESVPKTLESSKNIIRIRPTKQPGTRYAASYGDTIKGVEHRSETFLSDGKVIPIVIDPRKITGDSYKVVFSIDAVTHDFVWSLINTTTGQPKVSNMTNQSGNDLYPIVDGILVKVISPPAGINVDETYWTPETDFWLRDLPGAGGDNDGDGIFVGNHFFDSNLGAGDLVKVELRFDAANPQKAYRYIRLTSPTRYLYQDYVNVPFTAWDITSDPPRQLNIAWSDRNPAAGNGIWDPDNSSAGGREYTFILKSDYSETPDPYYTSRDLLNNADEFDVLFVLWPQLRSGHSLNESVGKLTITPNFVNAPKDTFFFNSANYVPTSSVEIAKQDIDKIMAVPNPYFGASEYERNQFGRIMRFTNLPPKCTIRIFNLQGTMIRRIDKDDQSTTTDWDLQNNNGLPVASGMYIVHIDMPDIGTKILKVAVIMAEERLDNF
ncbi:MAG: putative lipoprotein [Ignavibacteriae bacterium]|nr:MAG: putative lipoprotein [Ignavibacteriota bacterium]